MLNIFEVAARHRAELNRRLTAANSRLLVAYQAAWEQIEADLADVLRSLAEVPPVLPDGSPNPRFSESWLGRRERYERLREQLAERILRVARYASAETRRGQRALVEAAGRHVNQIIRAASPGVGAQFDRFADDALREFVGLTGDGSALKESFERLGRNVVEQLDTVLPETISRAIDRRLQAGIGAGNGGERIVRDILRTVPSEARAEIERDTGYRNRLRMAVHSSQMWSYREATRLGYEENEDIIKGWRWLSARTVRTCAACFALDGRVFELKQPQNPHPNCRCTMVPVLDDEPVETGAERFEKLSDAEKESILGGRAALLAYKDGRLTLDDLAIERPTKGYGDQWSVASLSQALGRDVAASYFRRAGG